MCSTPFGINELFTVGICYRRERPKGAQRLSASTNCSPSLPNLASMPTSGAQRLSASTNCSRGGAGGGAATAARVLNAFRHQRTVHRRRWLEPGQTYSACAQRLSASTNCSPKSPVTNLSHHRSVLNAFRHQRTVHLASRPTRSIALSVLNAFRHQRTVHARFVDDRDAVRMCSTPFGINELFTG